MKCSGQLSFYAKEQVKIVENCHFLFKRIQVQGKSPKSGRKSNGKKPPASRTIARQFYQSPKCNLSGALQTDIKFSSDNVYSPKTKIWLERFQRFSKCRSPRSFSLCCVKYSGRHHGRNGASRRFWKCSHFTIFI